jgi:hypothetical protein
MGDKRTKLGFLGVAALAALFLSLATGHVGSLPASAQIPEDGVMAVDCDSGLAGIQAACEYPSGANFHIQIHVIPPGVGYSFLQVELSWTDEVLDYVPAANPRDEALWPDCKIPGRADQKGLPLLFICDYFPHQTSTFAGAALEFEMQCTSDELTALDLLRFGPSLNGTLFRDAQDSVIRPARSPAIVTCGVDPTETPTPTSTETPEPGSTPTSTLPVSTPGATSEVAALPAAGSAGGSTGAKDSLILAGALGVLALLPLSAVGLRIVLRRRDR